MPESDTDLTTWTLLDELRGHDRNVKLHDLQLVIRSLRRFGFADPVVVDQRTGLLAAGHGRTAALRAMRDDGEDRPEFVLSDESGRWLVPTFVGWSSKDDLEAEAAMVALNRTTEAGGWDDAGLADLLARLEEAKDRWDGIGWDADDLADLRSRLSVQIDLAPDGGFDDLGDTIGTTHECPRCSYSW